MFSISNTVTANVAESRQRLDRFIRKAYIQFLTLCLGFFSLANVFHLLGFSHLRPIALVATAVMVSLNIGRALYMPDIFLKELHTPAGLAAYQTGVMATYFMASMLYTWDPSIASGIWIIAFACNILLITLFIQQYIRYNFSFMSITPVWYLIFVGIGAAAITGQQLGFYRLAPVVLIYALTAYVIMTPVILYRLRNRHPFARKMQPTKAIMCAAPSLCGVALMNVWPDAPMSAALPFVVLGQLFLFWLYSNFSLFRTIPFCVTFGSFTFPLGISCTSLWMFINNYLPAGSNIAQGLRILASVELAIATLVIAYVIWLFIYNARWLWYATRHADVATPCRTCTVD